MTYFFKLKKKNLFFANVPNFWSKRVFPQNQAVMHNFIRVSSTMPKFREISWSSSKKTPWQMSGGKDRQTLLHWILPATARGLTSTTPIDWHLKVKNYCITISMQKISSIHKLIQQIIGSHELHDHAHFLPSPSKSHWNNF